MPSPFVGIRARLRRWRDRRDSANNAVISMDDPNLRVVVTAFDETEAASAALERGIRWCRQRPAVLRHHLLLPDARIDSARALLEPDNWCVRREEPTDGQDKHRKLNNREGQETEGGHENCAGIPVTATRIQHLDALPCSQESARMASLAQRLGGTALGWDALQPDTATDPATDYCRARRDG